LKAMILAAGLGTRMRPLTDLLAKPALPVLNRPLILWTLERLARHGLRDVAINLHHLPDTVRAAVDEGKRLGLRVTFSFEPSILGTGGGPRGLRRFFDDGPFLLVNGDVLFDFDLTGLAAQHRASGALATLVLRPNPDARRYASVVTRSDGRIVSLPGVRRRRRGRRWLFTGVQILEPSLLERLPEGPSDTVRDLYAPLVDGDALLLGTPLRGRWLDLGTPELYRRGQLALLPRGSRTGRGSSFVDPAATVSRSAEVRRSVIGPGARVAAGARVSGSVLWAAAEVGAGAALRDSIVVTGGRVGARQRLRDAVVMPEGSGDSA
jgi:mannose-1-phosphate guanylyltransferase